MGSKLDDLTKLNNDKSIPGPGSYSHDKLNVQTKAPAYGIRPPTSQNKSRFITPDPQSYNPVDSLIKNKIPGFKMGKERRKPNYDEKSAALHPGSGHYNVNNSDFSG